MHKVFIPSISPNHTDRGINIDCKKRILLISFTRFKPITIAYTGERKRLIDDRNDKKNPR